MAAHLSSIYLNEVVIVPPHDLADIVLTLRIWKRYMNSALYDKKLDKTSSLIKSDFSLVLRLMQNDMKKIMTEASRRLFIVKDNTSQIQAILSLKIDESSAKSPSLHICQLITAPWNLRLNVKLYDKPMQGAGVCAIVGALFFAKKIGAGSIQLSSTPTGYGFYQKIGMAREGIHRFTLKVEKEATLKLQSAFMKAIEPTKKEGHSLLIKLGK